MLSRLIRNIGIVILITGLCMADSPDLIYPIAFVSVGALMTAVGAKLEEEK